MFFTQQSRDEFSLSLIYMPSLPQSKTCKPPLPSFMLNVKNASPRLLRRPTVLMLLLHVLCSRNLLQTLLQLPASFP